MNLRTHKACKPVLISATVCYQDFNSLKFQSLGTSQYFGRMGGKGNLTIYIFFFFAKKSTNLLTVTGGRGGVFLILLGAAILRWWLDLFGSGSMKKGEVFR